MHRIIPALLILLMIPADFISIARAGPAKEYLTEKEIEMIQSAQEIDTRVTTYLIAASSRLKAAGDRLRGRESEPGDPLEFFSVEDMLDGYYRIIRSIMYNIDSAFQKPKTDRGRIKRALKNLRGKMDEDGAELLVLKKTAEEKKNELLLDLIVKAIDITDGAQAGASEGLSQISAEEKKREIRTH
jgi:hypothetical protein